MAKRKSIKSDAVTAFEHGAHWIESVGAAVDASDAEIIEYATVCYDTRDLRAAFVSGVNSMLVEGNKVVFP